MKSEIIYSLYDSRYLSKKEDALLYTTCNSVKEAENDKKDFFSDAVIVKEEVLWNKKNGECLVVSSKIIKHG